MLHLPSYLWESVPRCKQFPHCKSLPKPRCCSSLHSLQQLLRPYHAHIQSQPASPARPCSRTLGESHNAVLPSLSSPSTSGAARRVSDNHFRNNTQYGCWHRIIHRHTHLPRYIIQRIELKVGIARHERGCPIPRLHDVRVEVLYRSQRVPRSPG